MLGPVPLIDAETVAHPPPSAPALDFHVFMLGLRWLRFALTDLIQIENAPPSNAASGARAQYESERAALRAEGTPSAVDRLSTIFRLAPFDEDCLLLAAAPRLDATFIGLFRHAHGSTSGVSATPHLAIALLADAGSDAVRLAHTRLSPMAPLRRFRLVELDPTPPSMMASLETDERIARYLIGEDYPDPVVRSWLMPVPPAPPPLRQRASATALAHLLSAERRPCAAIIGPPNSGRKSVAQCVAGRLGLSLRSLRIQRLPEQESLRQSALALLAREAALGDHVLLVDATDESVRDEVSEIVRQLDAYVLVTAREPVPGVPVELRLPVMDSSDRAALWREAFEPGAQVPLPALDRIAEQFPLSPATIAGIAASTQDGDEATVWAACRAAAGHGLDALAERITPRCDWDDIVLPGDLVERLRAVTAQVRHRADVYGRGGFGRKLVRGKGVTALFAGPSGTGKTMAAEIIAGDLGLDLCRIDLAGVVSKYIGETERNLKRVFDAAEAGGAVLFFDEADALFGKRSEVKDSHDRYANIEISYLLQRMEAYAGLAVLATNLKTHLDVAFLRRLRHVIDFPFPDTELRRTMWERAFPSETACANLDVRALARMELTGGNITVIAVNAAFLAAADGRPVDMSDIARAARAEFRKLDKEFRPLWPEAR
jgi:hypothetical protein